MPDETTWILVATALAGCAAVVQHFYDRFAANGLYRRTERRTREIPAQIGVEVENALNRVAASQRADYEAEAKKLETSAAMSMVRSVGVDKQMQATVSRALSEAILGPALPILRQFAPGLADTLEENPQLVDVVIQNPLFKKYIEPRLAAFLGTKSEPSSSDNPFLKGLGQP